MPAGDDAALVIGLAGPKAAAVYVIEDLHWIDGVSESLVADFVAVVPQTHSLVLISYAPNIGARRAGCPAHTASPLRR